MKTIKLLFIALFIVSAGFITSCGEETEPIGPTIDFIAGEGLITGDAALETGDNLSFTVTFTEGDSKLESFTIRHDDLELDGYPKTDIKDADRETYSTLAEVGTQVYTMILTDKDGLTDTKTLTITVTNPVVAPTITSYTTKILGASQNAVGSSFASIDGSVYKLADAAANSAKIDFVYFYGDTNKASLAAPSNTEGAQVVYPSIKDWATKNATVLEVTTMDKAAFDAVESDTQITAPSGTATLVNNLAIGKVIAFQTSGSSSKKGLILVTALTAENTGSISIEVKVQK